MTIGNLLNTQVLPFSSINKSYLPENAELKAIETLAKQAATANATMVDDNGEIITPAQVTYTKPCIIVT